VQLKLYRYPVEHRLHLHNLVGVSILEKLDGSYLVSHFVRQIEVSALVTLQLQFETVRRGLFRRVHHAGVVDQQFDPRIGRPQFSGGRSHRLQRRQIEGGATATSARGQTPMIRDAAAFPFSTLRTASTTRAPWAAGTLAVSKPSPVLAPVTMATRPV
jgi:hypothetical protein